MVRALRIVRGLSKLQLSFFNIFLSPDRVAKNQESLFIPRRLLKNRPSLFSRGGKLSQRSKGRGKAYPNFRIFRCYVESLKKVGIGTKRFALCQPNERELSNWFRIFIVQPVA